MSILLLNPALDLTVSRVGTGIRHQQQLQLAPGAIEMTQLEPGTAQ